MTDYSDAFTKEYKTPRKDQKQITSKEQTATSDKTEEYEISKPKRIIIRAQIAHD